MLRPVFAVNVAFGLVLGIAGIPNLLILLPQRIGIARMGKIGVGLKQAMLWEEDEGDWEPLVVTSTDSFQIVH